jgi:hypothetical protein
MKVSSSATTPTSASTAIIRSISCCSPSADTPPPLSSLADQLHAATLASSLAGTAGLKDGELRVAATTHAQKPATTAGSSAANPFKRGFLDSKPSKQVSDSCEKQQQWQLHAYMRSMTGHMFAPTCRKQCSTLLYSRKPSLMLI